MIIQTFNTPGLAINTYLVGDETSKRAVVIDPTRHVEPYIEYAKKEGLTITDITETHVHADFLSGAKELKYRLQNKPTIHCSALGGPEWIPSYADHKVLNGDNIILGNIRLKALHTPGHTPEHIVWLCFDESKNKEIPSILFSGDLLFVGSVGRPDLLGISESTSLAKQLYNSLFNILAPLSDFIEILPAHGAGSLCGKGLSDRPTSTLGNERHSNPFLIKQPIEQWIIKLKEDMPGAPINFQRIKKINVEGPPLLSDKPQKTSNHKLIIDLRNPEIYAKAHIKDSINVPFGSTFCNWFGSIIDADTSLGLISDAPEILAEAKKNLQLIGFDQLFMERIWNEIDLKKEFTLTSLPFLSVETVVEKINNLKQPTYILDVRTPSEWNTGHIEGAHHLELSHLKNNLNQIPKEQSIITICGGGYRASIAASLLKEKGFNDVSNMRGGMSGWHKAKLPVV